MNATSKPLRRDNSDAHLVDRVSDDKVYTVAEYQKHQLQHKRPQNQFIEQHLQQQSHQQNGANGKQVSAASDTSNK